MRTQSLALLQGAVVRKSSSGNLRHSSYTASSKISKLSWQVQLTMGYKLENRCTPGCLYTAERGVILHGNQGPGNGSDTTLKQHSWAECWGDDRLSWPITGSTNWGDCYIRIPSMQSCANILATGAAKTSFLYPWTTQDDNYNVN